jgi:hypothetical protein
MKTNIPAALFLVSIIIVVTLSVAMATGAAGPETTATTGVTTRVSVASDGTEGNGGSYRPSTSGDGRYVAFWSYADNLVASDTNGASDVFVHDRLTGETTRVSVASKGTEGNDGSSGGSVSDDGRYVAFHSFASNLVPGDRNECGAHTYGHCSDVFVHDRMTGETSRVSIASDGTEGNSSSGGQSISANGRYVAFGSNASNLMPGDTNGAQDVFVHDRVTGLTTRVSVASDGTQANDGSYGPSISGDGRYVAFSSMASNLVPGDMNEQYDVFVHDRATRETVRVSVASDGTEGNGYSRGASISTNGRYVAFESEASNLIPEDRKGWKDIFVHHVTTGETSRVSVASDGTQGNWDSNSPSISANGGQIAFASRATNLDPDDTNRSSDIFVHHRVTGETTRVSVASDGTQGNWDSNSPSLSADGSQIAFHSYANNLVPGDTNWRDDVFVHDRAAGYGVALSGSTAVLAPPGTTVTYTLTLGNTGVLTDTYNLALDGNAWPTVIDSATSVTLVAGTSSEVRVVVSVPSRATIGDRDSVTFNARAQGNPGVGAVAVLTTTVSGDFNTYLPLIAKP